MSVKEYNLVNPQRISMQIPEILSTYMSAKVGLCDRDLENFKLSTTLEGLARFVT